MIEEPNGQVLSTNPCREILVETYKGYDIVWCEGIEDDEPWYYAIPKGTYGVSEAIAESSTLEDVKDILDLSLIHI